MDIVFAIIGITGAALVCKFVLWLGGELERSRQRERQELRTFEQAEAQSQPKPQVIAAESTAINIVGGYFDGSILPAPPRNGADDNVLRIVKDDAGDIAVGWIGLGASRLDEFTDCTVAADYAVQNGRGQLLKEFLG